MVASTGAPRVWLAGGGRVPSEVAQVRDDQARVWQRGHDGLFHTADGRHHLAVGELSARTDLTEVAGAEA